MASKLVIFRAFLFYFSSPDPKSDFFCRKSTDKKFLALPSMQSPVSDKRHSNNLVIEDSTPEFFFEKC